MTQLRFSGRSLSCAMALGLLVACGGNGKKEPGKDPAPAPTPAPAAPAPASVSPQELYDQCRDRMENPEDAGECQADTDCASAGCNREVCTTVAKSKEWNTACEEKPCFKVADQCGCHDGKCTWTLKSEAPPAPALGNKLPPPGN